MTFTVIGPEQFAIYVRATCYSGGMDGGVALLTETVVFATREAADIAYAALAKTVQVVKLYAERQL